MANRYWVGGTANWDATAGTKWATTSGGAGGAAVPTISDTVFFDAASGANTVTISAAAISGVFDSTGFTGTIAGASTWANYGNFTLGAGTTMTYTGGLTLSSTGTKSFTVTTNNVTITTTVFFNEATTIWTLQDNLTISNTRSLQLTRGTLNIDGKTVTAGGFTSSNANSRTLNFGSNGTMNFNGAFTVTTSTNLTVSGTGTINIGGASAKTFDGGGKTWPTLNQAGSGTLTIAGSNTFTNITNTVQPTTITFTAGTTQTVSQFGVSGTPFNLVTINTTVPGSAATISDSSGTNTVSYVSIKDITAAGGATWIAYTTSGNINSGGNTGWIFTDPNAITFTQPISLRSLAQRGRF